MNYLAARRQEEKDRRRDEILEASAAMAAEHGTAALTMDQIARKARLSRALLYVYFRDKEDLLLGLADRAHDMLHDRFAEICSKRQTGLKMIQGMGRAYVAFAEESPVYFEALSCFAAHAPDRKDKHSNAARCMQNGDRIHGLMVQAIEKGIEDGSIRPDVGSPSLLAITLWGLMYGIIQIIATKGEMLAHKGVNSGQVIENALSMATRALEKSRGKGR